MIAYFRGSEGHPVAPFLQQGADELVIQGPASLTLLSRSVSGAMVRDVTTAGDVLLGGPAHRPGHEANGVLVLVGQNLVACQPGAVTHGDVDQPVANITQTA